MSEQLNLVEVIQALADPLRLAMLQQLMAGPATVSELVVLSGATQPNISNHLALLRERGLVRASRQGRASVYELRDATVAQLVESLLALAGNEPAVQHEPDAKTAGRASPTLTAARTCYDHLAGRLGVALFDTLVARGAIGGTPDPGQAVELGPEAQAVFGALGIDLATVRRARRRFATGCLDWTERRPHLGGALGAAIWAASAQRGWVAREPGARALVVTDAGRRGFHEWLGIEVGAECGWRAGQA